jgi:NDP-sugar pyrophosphorylase family protein
MSMQKIKAMVLAAGLGTRLQPFTDNHPKALYETEGATLLEHALRDLNRHGITEVIVNVHHFSEQILRFLEENGNFGMKVAISDETDMLLETGGGLKKAAWFFSDCNAFVVRNVDVISTLDLTAMIRVHLAAKPLATLAVRKRETARYFLFDDKMRLSGWINKKTGEQRIHRVRKSLRPLAFSGIQVMSPEIFPLITETGKFSLTNLYVRLCRDHTIQGYEDQSPLWKDIGTL